MVKLVGSTLIFSGTFLLWHGQMAARRNIRDTLSDLILVFHRMAEGIRMTRKPLAPLLEQIAGDCHPEVRELLLRSASAARQGENLVMCWQKGVDALPLQEKAREIAKCLDFQGDEEAVCKDLSLASFELAKQMEALEQSHRSEEKRTTALCFSGAALLVILLI